jgi:hypothetical protein
MILEHQRLQPDHMTLLELYLRSGNVCAFPGCDRRMVNLDGVVVGQPCYIEAAEFSGPRFNANQTDDECRDGANLLLMCYEHQLVTNDAVEYPVERMRQFKQNHEGQYSTIIEKIAESFFDETELRPFDCPTTLAGINARLGWNNSIEELQYTLDGFMRVVEQLRKVPKSARILLSIVLSRGNRAPGWRSDTIKARLSDVVAACEAPESAVIKQVGILTYHEVARVCRTDEESPFIVLDDFELEWAIWPAIKDFCEASGYATHALLVDGRFSLLDKVD